MLISKNLSLNGVKIWAGHQRIAPMSFLRLTIYKSTDKSISHAEERPMLKHFKLLPNILSLFRIGMAPAVSYFIISDQLKAATFTFAACAITDFVKTGLDFIDRRFYCPKMADEVDAWGHS